MHDTEGSFASLLAFSGLPEMAQLRKRGSAIIFQIFLALCCKGFKKLSTISETLITNFSFNKNLSRPDIKMLCSKCCSKQQVCHVQDCLHILWCCYQAWVVRIHQMVCVIITQDFWDTSQQLLYQLHQHELGMTHECLLYEVWFYPWHWGYQEWRTVQRLWQFFSIGKWLQDFNGYDKDWTVCPIFCIFFFTFECKEICEMHANSWHTLYKKLLEG